MHPELLNNSLFLRYYQQWQQNPASIVFAPIAEYFLMYGMIDAAFKVCREGIKKHPTLVSGRLVMARIHLKRGNWDEAEAELRNALEVAPQNQTARALLRDIERLQLEEDAAAPASAAPVVPQGASWNTVTMAKIFAEQGHPEKARQIYHSILTSDPANQAAREGLAVLGQAS